MALIAKFEIVAPVKVVFLNSEKSMNGFSCFFSHTTNAINPAIATA